MTKSYKPVATRQGEFLVVSTDTSRFASAHAAVYIKGKEKFAWKLAKIGTDRQFNTATVDFVYAAPTACSPN